MNRRSTHRACVYHVVSNIPSGKVSTYGRIAKVCGMKSSREVGRILHENPDPKEIPCHRVVHSDGSIAVGYAFGGRKKQIEILGKEGILIVNGKVQTLNTIVYP